MNKTEKRMLRQAKKQMKAAAKRKNPRSAHKKNPVAERVKEIRETVGKNADIKPKDTPCIALSLASDYIPIEEVKDGIIKTTDGRFLKIIKIMPVGYSLKEEGERERIISEYARYLKVAPAKIQIKCMAIQSPVNGMMDVIDKNKILETKPEAVKFYDDQKDLLFKTARNEGISHNFYMIIEYVPEYLAAKNDYTAARKQLYDAEMTAAKYLSRCGNKVVTLTENPDFTQLENIYEILNRDRALDVPLGVYMDYYEKNWLNAYPENRDVKDISVREYVSPEVLDFNNNRYIISDGRYMSAIALSSNGFLQDAPDAWVSWISNLGEGIDVDLFITKENRQQMSEKVYRSGKIKRLRLNDRAQAGSEEDSTYSLADSVSSAEYIRRGLRMGYDFYWVSMLIYVSATSLAGLDYKLSEVKKYLKSLDFKVNPLLNLQEDAYRAFMPFRSLDKRIFELTKQNMLTDGLAGMYPFTSTELSSEDGILFGIAEGSNAVVTLNPFDTKTFSNANMVVIGTSGGGKTYSLSLIAIRQRLKHIPVCIIAPIKGFEFARVCREMGGSYITISPSSASCINVMDILLRNDSDNYIDTLAESSLLAEKAQSLMIFFSIAIPDLSYEEKQLIDDAIIQTYNNFGITQDNRSLKDESGRIKQMPTLGDLRNQLLKVPEAKRVSNILKRLTDGSAKSFNQHTNVDLDNEFTVIDISNLSGDMLLVGMYVALDYVWSKAKEDRTEKKTIIIDELWKLLGAGSNELAAGYVLEIYKTIRGYGGSVIGATQNLSDFRALGDGKYGKGIINNSEIRLILKLKPFELSEVAEALGLNESEANRTLTLEHQGLLIAGDNRVVVNIRASDMEHRYITTDREDLKKIKEEAIKNDTKTAEITAAYADESTKQIPATSLTEYSEQSQTATPVESEQETSIPADTEKTTSAEPVKTEQNNTEKPTSDNSDTGYKNKKPHKKHRTDNREPEGTIHIKL